MFVLLYPEIFKKFIFLKNKMKLRTLFPITIRGLSGRGTLESRKFNAALFSYRKSRKLNPRNNRQGNVIHREMDYCTSSVQQITVEKNGGIITARTRSRKYGQSLLLYDISNLHLSNDWVCLPQCRSASCIKMLIKFKLTFRSMRRVSDVISRADRSTRKSGKRKT